MDRPIPLFSLQSSFSVRFL